MKVNRSAYYAYASRSSYQTSSPETSRVAAIRTCFEVNRRRYGSRRIAAQLKIGRATVQKIMRGENLRAIQAKQFKPQTTDSKHGLPVCANLLQNGANAPTGKGEVFIGDITYLRLADGTFCYLAVLQDKFTRRIVGWKVSERMTAQLVIDVFNQARRRGLIGKGAIIHTDQGSQYVAVEYRRLLYIGGFRQSMSRKGNCYDNAQRDQFFLALQSRISRKGHLQPIQRCPLGSVQLHRRLLQSNQDTLGLGYKKPDPI